MIIAKFEPEIIDKIPKNCGECPFAGFYSDDHAHYFETDFCCSLTNIDSELFPGRLKYCPLVEVKEG